MVSDSLYPQGDKKRLCKICKSFTQKQYMVLEIQFQSINYAYFARIRKNLIKFNKNLIV